MSAFALGLADLRQITNAVYHAIAAEEYILAEQLEDQRLQLLHRLPGYVTSDAEQQQLAAFCRAMLEEDQHYQQRIELAKQDIEEALSHFMSQRRAVKAYHSGY
jgi:D-ribose pyranose/furanose isomerase RbsD